MDYQHDSISTGTLLNVNEPDGKEFGGEWIHACIDG